MINNSSKVSIIVPCYNQAQYLDDCLQSVLNQSYLNWECIIVNDGSPDNTAEIASFWCSKDDRFKYLCKENGGLSSARNSGLELACGDWIQFLDCDDLLEPNKLANAIDCYQEGVDVLISGYRYFYDKEGVSKLRIYGNNYFLPEVYINKDDFVDLKVLFRNKNPFVISAPIYSKHVFNKVGFFNTSLKALEDWEFNLRCVFKDVVFHHIGYSSESKALIRLHGNSMMRNNELMQDNLIKFNNIVNQNQDVLSYFGLTYEEANKRPNPILKRVRKVVRLIIPPLFIKLFIPSHYRDV